MTRSTNRDCTLVIMAKAPRPGSGKDPVGSEPSCCCHPRAIPLPSGRYDRVSEVTRRCRMSPSCVRRPMSTICHVPRVMTVRVVAQSGDGLAAGLTSVFAHFATAGDRRIVAFNSDSPHLPASVLEKRVRGTRPIDVVVGPTHDGGYYLVGAKASHPGLFEGDGTGHHECIRTPDGAGSRP